MDRVTLHTSRYVVGALLLAALLRLLTRRPDPGPPATPPPR
ncbi:hypothetical protein Aph02nite_28980 [Actinoplanes philippinensis]|uniref:Uncharacterized protein n=1 Tax=Actinoplanes philippinensis TaxID=35752 RepID=A0A1I2EKY1_9ACTN|nr:hypothetical protein [Actinoplanes philippinensis]GIE76948.1 hypothetical protein Aph02nite_28980 [Actinoplanes philippinensis]SFE92900.1 hypothetical protein SAMN05421541_104512 [Actinoplanes philippinensis]